MRTVGAFEPQKDDVRHGTSETSWLLRNPIKTTHIKTDTRSTTVTDIVTHLGSKPHRREGVSARIIGVLETRKTRDSDQTVKLKQLLEKTITFIDLCLVLEGEVRETIQLRPASKRGGTARPMPRLGKRITGGPSHSSLKDPSPSQATEVIPDIERSKIAPRSDHPVQRPEHKTLHQAPETPGDTIL